MKRRSFISLLAGIPFLGFLKPVSQPDSIGVNWGIRLRRQSFHADSCFDCSVIQDSLNQTQADYEACGRCKLAKMMGKSQTKEEENSITFADCSKESPWKGSRWSESWQDVEMTEESFTRAWKNIKQREKE